MLKQFDIINAPFHFINGIKAIIATPSFIKENKLWTGFFEYKWIMLITITISLLVSFFLFDDLFISESTNSLHAESTEIINTEELNVNQDNYSTTTIEEVKDNSKKGAKSSGSKYLILVLLEVLIFHLSVRSLSVYTGESIKLKFLDFVKAEKRMIKLLFISWVKGIVAGIIISILLGIIGLGFLKSIIMFLVYSYFIGFAFFDNYNEQYNHNMKESLNIVRLHMGAAISIGIIITCILYVPLIGPFVAPIIGAVSAVIYGQNHIMVKNKTT